MNEQHDQGLTFEALLSLVAADEAAEVDRPHIVICRNLDLGCTTYSGPYATAQAACAAADVEAAEAALEFPGAADVLDFSVAPLFGGHPAVTAGNGPRLAQRTPTGS